MKTRNSTLKNLTRQFRNTKKSTKAAGTKQRTSFTPGMESLETRALLTTMPGLTIEPTADATTQVANDIENQDNLVNDLRVTSAIDKSSTKIAESVCKGKVFPQVERNVPNQHSPLTNDLRVTSATDEDHKDWFSTSDGIMSGTDTGALEEIANSQKNDAAYIKFDGIMAGTDTSDMEAIAKGQRNDAAYIKFDGIMQAPGRTMPAHHAAVDQLFTQEGLKDFFNPATSR